MANCNLNKTILIGRLTSDPELKQTQSGVSVCSFSIAVNRRFSKEEQKADFINCIAWRQQAEFLCKYFGRGSSVCIVGHIETRSWMDNNNQKRYATEVVAEEISFVDSKSEAAAEAPPYSNATQFEEMSADEDLPF